MSAYYELLELLGEGGMGRVHRARHHPSGLEVAIKSLRSEWRDDPERRRLFLDEATAAARLDDPRIVRLLDVGQDQHGAPFLVMELVDGVELESWLAPWPGWENVERVLLDVLEGLSEAHAAGIVHRDLKPSNVLVERASGRARILDFGVATMLDPLQAAGATRIAGTPELMAPEQLLGTGATGPWTDLYAFGVIVAFVLTGRSPFEGVEDLPSLAARKLEPTTLGAAREGLSVPYAMRALLERLLAPHPRARPRFAAEVRAELIDACAHVRDEVPRGSMPRAPRSGSHALDDATEVDLGGAARPAAAGPSSVVLASELPAPSDPEHGLSLARLREPALVGREAERELIESAIASVIADGGAHAIVLEGEVGIGKSRLARWGLAEVERTGAMEGAAGGYDAGGGSTAGGLRHALARLLGAPPRHADPDQPDPALAAWQWLADASIARVSVTGSRSSQSGDPELDRVLLARFVRADAGKDTLSEEEIARLAHAALRALGRLRPVYLWLDDVAWSRDGALALVERLLDANDVPALVVLTVRSETVEHQARARLARIVEHPRTTVRVLEGLSDAAISDLAGAAIPLAPGIAGSIAAVVPHSPLHVLTALREWVASGVLVRTDEGYAPRPGSDIERAIGARSLERLVSDRLERLLASFEDAAPAAEAVLVRAALLGARLEADALRATVSESPSIARSLDAVLDRALPTGILRVEPEGLLAFENRVVHEAVLARAARDARARIDVANGLQQRYGKERADVVARVSQLLYDAGVRDLAWERLLAAIDRSAWASDDLFARQLLTIAERWQGDAPERASRLAWTRANVHYLALRYDESVRAVSEARAIAEADGDATMALRCDALFADIACYQDRLATSRHAALAIWEQLDVADPDHASIAGRVAQRLSDLDVLRGDVASALVWRQRCRALEEAAGRPWLERVARLNIAEILMAEGRHEEAAATLDAVIAEARADRDDDGLGASLDMRAHLHLAAGRAAEARADNDGLLVRLEARGDLWRLTRARALDAATAVELDPPAEIESRARAFLDAYRRVPRDEVSTTHVASRLERGLRARGMDALADEVAAALAARRDAIALGFSR